MKMTIKLVGDRNDLELGIVEDGPTYFLSGLLADKDHQWKILAWIDQELEQGTRIKVVKVVSPDQTSMFQEPPALENSTQD